jgi:hypothetical protein
MKLPREVNILGTPFAVVEVDQIEMSDCGESSQHGRVIRIDSKLDDDAKVETFYHELVHMVFAHMGYGRLLRDDLDEALAQGLGMALCFIVTANDLPKLAKEE